MIYYQFYLISYLLSNVHFSPLLIAVFIVFVFLYFVLPDMARYILHMNTFIRQSADKTEIYRHGKLYFATWQQDRYYTRVNWQSNIHTIKQINVNNLFGLLLSVRVMTDDLH